MTGAKSPVEQRADQLLFSLRQQLATVNLSLSSPPRNRLDDDIKATYLRHMAGGGGAERSYYSPTKALDRAGVLGEGQTLPPPSSREKGRGAFGGDGGVSNASAIGSRKGATVGKKRRINYTSPFINEGQKKAQDRSAALLAEIRRQRRQAGNQWDEDARRNQLTGEMRTLVDDRDKKRSFSAMAGARKGKAALLNTSVRMNQTSQHQVSQ